MLRRALFTVAGVGVLSVVLFGRDACSYVSTMFSSVSDAVESNVPTEFQIERARKMVEDSRSEIRNSMHVIAKEEVELDNLNSQIDEMEDRAGKEKQDILKLQSDLASNRKVFRYAGQSYTVSEVKEDLSRRFSRYKVADDTLSNLLRMRDARQNNLDAARQKLVALMNQRRKLEVDIQNLQARAKLVEVAQTTSNYNFDCNSLTRAKELISDIRTRLEVQTKLANADVQIDAHINLDGPATTDITSEVASYFGIGEEATRQVATVSFEESR